MTLSSTGHLDAEALGLPSATRGCLFDMDGVLTRTASVHAAAWKQMFDEFFSRWTDATGERPAPFTLPADYEQYLDGRSREDGVRAVLSSRRISLPPGGPGDPPGANTVHELSRRKNDLLLQVLARDGVQVFDDAVLYARTVRDNGLVLAVVSASANTVQVLEAAGISDLFDVRIDGLVATEKHLAGKPAPDMYLAGAKALSLDPSLAVVFEDALAGVEAGRAGGFGLVVGVDRVGHGQALKAHGADVVVTDLTSLLRDEANKAP